MKRQEVISERVFAFYLSSYNDPKLPSSLSFGSYDLEKYALEDFSYVPVERTTGLWTVPLQRISIGLEVLEESRNAVFNTDSSLISISAAAFDQYRAVLCGLVACNSIDLSFPCENGEDAKLPMLTFTMGEQEFPIAPEHYVWRVDQQCYSLVVSTDSSEDELGHPFMLAYYTLFDAENYRIGLARSVSNPFPASNWYIWLGIGVIGVVVVAVAV